MTATHTQDRLMRQLGRAYAEKLMCLRMLSEQVAQTQDSRYRSTLEEHLKLTEGHARRLKDRLELLGEDTTAQDLSVRMATFAQRLVKLPLDSVHPESYSERLLRSARDQCALEAREVATYYVLEGIANELGDRETARLCADVRAGDEQAFLGHLHETIPSLVPSTVHNAQSSGEGPPIWTVARIAGWLVRNTVSQGLGLGRRLSSLYRRGIEGGEARLADSAIAGYDALSAETVIRQLPRLSQRELDVIDDYEHTRRQRRSVLRKIRSLRGPEPWPGYDELTVAEITVALGDSDPSQLEAVCDYERCHRARRRVLERAESRLPVS